MPKHIEYYQYPIKILNIKINNSMFKDSSVFI